MIKNSGTKKYLVISIILFIVLLASSVFALFVINKEKEKVKTISNDLSIANKEDVVALKRAIRNYEASADSIQNLLVDKNEVFNFISEVENLVKDSGATVDVQNIDLFDVLKNGEMVRNVGQEVAERTHGKFVMNLRVEGGWIAVSSFLLKMENFPKHISIEALKLNSVFDPGTKRQYWSANFNIVTTTN
jgi:hypothetical protein